MDAIGSGSDVPSLVAKVRELEMQKRIIETQLADLRPVPRLPRAVVQEQMDAWRRQVRTDVQSARNVVQKVLRGRITFTPREDDTYEFTAETRFDRIFDGVAAPWLKIPKGTGADLIKYAGPDEVGRVIDEDYGRILEAAAKRAGAGTTGRRGRPWRDSNPRSPA